MQDPAKTAAAHDQYINPLFGIILELNNPHLFEHKPILSDRKKYPAS